MHKIKWTEIAVADLDCIELYIYSDNPSAAVDVVLRIFDTVETLLSNFPASSSAGRLIGTRELVLSDLPYIIPYRIKDGYVEILRVLHTSRKYPSIDTPWSFLILQNWYYAMMVI